MTAQFFATPAAFRRWLTKHHSSTPELWIGFYKKDAGKKPMLFAAALDEALCFGWVDGQKNTLDELSYRVRFTPRKAKSLWSQLNIGHAERLIAAGRMMPSGLAAIDLAKADGRWSQAYAPSSKAEPPADFLKALAKRKKAKAFYATLNKSNTYAIYHRIHKAKKPETRLRWIERILAMLEAGEVFHP